MAITAGDFSLLSPTRLKMRLGQMFSAQDQTYMQPTVAFDTLARGQRINLPDRFLDTTDCSTPPVELYFTGMADDCNLEATDCNNDCDIDGPELGADKVQLGEIRCKEMSFSVTDNQCKEEGISKEDKVTDGFARAISTLDLQLEKDMLATLGMYSDDLSDLSGILPVGGLTATGDAWQIEKDKWNNELLAHMSLIATDFGMIDPVLVSIGLFRFDKLVADNKQGCCNTDGLLSILPMADAIKTFNSVYPVIDNTAQAFLVDRAALAFYNFYDNRSRTPIEDASRERISRYYVPSSKEWRVNSSNRKVIYDVYEQTKCVNLREDKTSYKVRAQYGFAKKPTNCGSSPRIIRLEQTCASC